MASLLNDIYFSIFFVSQNNGNFLNKANPAFNQFFAMLCAYRFSMIEKDLSMAFTGIDQRSAITRLEAPLCMSRYPLLSCGVMN